MTLESIRKIIGWSAVINMALLLFIAIIFLAAKDWIYAIWGYFFHLSPAEYDSFVFHILAIWKILMFVFFIIPYVAIRMVEKRN